MNNSNFTLDRFPPLPDQDIARVIGGAAMPFAGFWQRLLTTVVEIGLEALLKEWKHQFMQRQRGTAA